MFSLENMVCGLNLSKVTQIIFLDPISGTSEYKNLIENKAKSRAYCVGQNNLIKVYKFLIKNTIEEEIYLNQSPL